MRVARRGAARMPAITAQRFARISIGIALVARHSGRKVIIN